MTMIGQSNSVAPLRSYQFISDLHYVRLVKRWLNDDETD
jgi:hypothetical protein